MAVKSKSVRVRLDDVKTLLRLMHEVHELPPVRERRVTHFLDALCPLLNSEVILMSELADCLPDRMGRLVSWTYGGWMAPSTLSKLGQYPAERDRFGPFNRVICSTRLPSGVHRRREHVRDQDHYRSDYYQDFCRTWGCDHEACFLRPLPQAGGMMALSIHQSLGKRSFGERERNLLALVGSEFDWLLKWAASPHPHSSASRNIGQLLARGGDQGDRSVTLTPQARRVLTLLLEGRSEKEIARLMFISRHTVHDYVKMIYRSFGVSSRAELLAKVLNNPHSGVA